MCHYSIQDDMVPTSTSTSSPLKVLVCGGGISGFAAAISLRNAGHHVEVFEKAQYSAEIGAAIHLPPNCTCLLERMGIDPVKDVRGTPCEYVGEYDQYGKQYFKQSTEGMLKHHPYPWLLAHRADLHRCLKDRALSEDAEGVPVKLHLSSPVSSADPENGKVVLENGEVHHGDLVVAADGVHSVLRKTVTGSTLGATPSGHNCFRFLIPMDVIRKAAVANPGLNQFLEDKSGLKIWIGSDRRIVFYPCRDNTLLNFVCLHPDSKDSGSAEEWDNRGAKEDLMECYKEFGDDIKSLISLVDDEEVKLWKLLDRESLTKWTEGNICLIGDAAHPFLPHQGQGGAQAIEDAVALGVCFPLGVTAQEVPELLNVYQKIRIERATTIQNFTRSQATSAKDKALNASQFAKYNFSHDAYFSAQKYVSRHFEQKSFKRMPIGFGPMQGPRQTRFGAFIDDTDTEFENTSIVITTSKSYLETFLPNDDFEIDSEGEFATLTVLNSTLKNIRWLGGKDYGHMDFYVDNVVYTSPDSGVKTRGKYLTFLFETRTEPILSGREELGYAKLFAECNVTSSEEEYRCEVSWEGNVFMEYIISDLKSSSDPKPPKPEATLSWKYIPACGQKGIADVEYCTYMPPEVGGPVPKVDTVKNGTGSIKFRDCTPEQLPCLYHVYKRLSDMPIFGFSTGTLAMGHGLPDLRNHRRL